MKIAILGHGNVGSKLAALLDRAEAQVALCSRDGADGTLPLEVGAAGADVVILAVPYTALAGLLPTLRDVLRGKVVVDCTNPLNADWSPLLLGQENSAGEETARLLPESRVVKAFNTIFADVMTPERQVRDGLRTTAFVAGDEADSKRVILDLAEQAGFAPVDAGPLRMARHLEAMAHLNIQIAVGQGGGTHAAFLYHQVKA